MSDTTDPINPSADQGSTNNNQTPKNQLKSILGSNSNLLKIVAAVSVVTLVGLIGFTDIFRGCGKAKVSGKNICQYIDLLDEVQEEKEIIDTLEKITKFGEKGQKAGAAIVDLIVNRDEQSIRNSALAALVAVGKGNLPQLLNGLISDQEIELEAGYRSNLFGNVLSETEPEDYTTLVQMAMGDDLSRIKGLMQSVSRHVLSREELKSSKGERYVNGLVDLMLWIAELEPQDGEITPPKEFLEAREGAFGLLGSFVMPTMAQIHKQAMKIEVSKDKLAEINERISGLAEEVLNDKDSPFRSTIIAHAFKIQNNPEEGLDLYLEFLGTNPMPPEEAKDALTVPLLGLIPVDCVAKVGIIKNDSSLPKEESKWNKTIAAKLLDTVNSNKSDSVVSNALAIGGMAAHCELSDSDPFYEAILKRELKSSQSFSPVNSDIQEVVRRLRAKRLQLEVGKQYLSRAALSDDMLVREAASRELENLVKAGFISESDLLQEQLSGYASSSVERREEILKDLVKRGTTSNDLDKSRDSVIAILKGELDGDVRSTGYELLIDKLLVSQWEKSAPVWEMALTDNDPRNRMRYLSKLQTALFPGYPYGSEIGKDPRPVAKILMKLGEGEVYSPEKGVWALLRRLAGSGTLEPETTAKIITKVLVSVDDLDANTCAWATDLIGRISDKTILLPLMEEVMQKARSPVSRGFARLVTDQVDHTKGRIVIDNGTIKLTLRPRTGDYDLERLVDTVNKSNKIGLGFLVIPSDQDREARLVKGATTAPEAEIISLDKFGRTLGVTSLPIPIPQKGEKAVRLSNGGYSLNLDQHTKFIVVVPKGTSAQQGITEGSVIPFDVEALGAFPKLERFTKRVF